ncbi:hypothetical protein OG413_21000 [Streptomyces sp. NBC_01433]|uniref:hypothetical protein n=1 Tax=Streptomyces sp. NBC_01433 TaxID=2903864 RepID=UPI00225B686B|nr:hypothetical protein [Streptomyces sp. NBC_01433]MCX4677755.1 hypothetical protein [Streptomyces sp. NBC_01433]
MAVVISLSACMPQSVPQSKDRVSPGSALEESGNQSSGTVGNENAKVGQVWWFALPIPLNTSDRDIEITDVSVVKPAEGVKILEYGAYNLEDTEGLPLMALEGAEDAPEFKKLKNYATEPVVVKANEESEIFFVARMKINSSPKGTSRYCRFDYKQEQLSYSQTLDCELDLQTN